MVRQSGRDSDSHHICAARHVCRCCFFVFPLIPYEEVMPMLNGSQLLRLPAADGLAGSALIA